MAFHFFHYVFEISLLCFISSYVFCYDSPHIDNVQVIDETSFTDKNSTFHEITVLLLGNNFHKNMKIKLSHVNGEYGSECLENETDNFEPIHLSEKWLNSTFSMISVKFPYDYDTPFTDFSLCVLNVSRTNNVNESDYDIGYNKWLHSGKSVSFRTKPLIDPNNDGFSVHVLPEKL